MCEREREGEREDEPAGQDDTERDSKQKGSTTHPGNTRRRAARMSF